MDQDNDSTAPPAAMLRSGSSDGSSNGSDSILQRLLATCGISSSSHQSHFAVVHPPDRIRLMIESELPRSASEKAAQFVDELKARCEDTQQLRRFLSHTQHTTIAMRALPSQSSHTVSSPHDDSVIRICLNVLSLQRLLIDWLLEQLVVNEDEWLAAEGIRTSSSSSSSSSQRAPSLSAQSLPPNCLTRLVLDALRMLDVVYDSDALYQKLSEVVDSLTSVKAEVISALPDILIDPCYHDRMADCLIAQLTANETALLLPVLDCLSRLHLTSRQKEKTVMAVRPLVASAKEKSLPALIRFLLQMTSDDSVKEILQAVRTHLPLLAEDNSEQKDGGKGGKEEMEQEDSAPLLITDALRSGLQHNQLACKAYIEVLKEVGDAKEHKAADVIVLFIIHGLPHNKQLANRAADTLRKKLLEGAVSSSLLHSAIANHVACIRPMFDSVAALAEQMVRKQSSRVVRDAGGAMQIDLFLGFDDRSQRMTIVQSWLQQLGSRETGEMDNALHCLQAVSADKAGIRALAAFFEYLKTVLQYLDDYKLTQIRTLFQLLAQLAFKPAAVSGSMGGMGDESGGHPFDTSLQVFVQKELHAPSLRDQRIGIVAVVALLQPIVLYSPPAESRFVSSQRDQHESMPNVLCSLLDQLFDSLAKCTARSASAHSFLYDELSLALDSGRLHKLEVLRRIHRHFISKYQPQLFVPRAHGEHPLPLTIDRQTMQVNCKDQMAGSDVIPKASCSFNIAPSLLQPSANRELMTLPAELRLLAAFYRADRPADDFIQLLIAPFTLPSPVGRNEVERIDHFKQQTPYLQRVWISSLFHTIQCLREIINAFSSSHLQPMESLDASQLSACLVHRIKQLIEAEDELRAMLRYSADFTAQQLLSMADSSDERYMREMGTLDGTIKADESSQYTTLDGKTHITQKKKKSTSNKSKSRLSGSKRGRTRSSSEDSSTESESADSDREEGRKKKKRAAAAKKKKKQASAPKKDDDINKSGPFDAVIRPLLRPLTIDVMTLLCNPLHRNLIIAAEAQKKASLKNSDGDKNILLLYKPMSGTANTRVPHLSIPVLRYLLTELRGKMEAVLAHSSHHAPIAPIYAKRASPVAVIPTSPAVDTPKDFVSALADVFRGVHDHSLVLNGFLNTSDVDDDDDIDRDDMSACLIACVQVMRLIVTCPALIAPSNMQSLRSAIIILLGEYRQSKTGVANLSQLGEQSVDTLYQLLNARVRGFLWSFRCLDDAVAVVAVIREMEDVRVQVAAAEEEKVNDKLYSIADKLLNKDWAKRVPLRKQNVGELVALLIKHAADPQATISKLTTRMHTLAMQESKKKKKKSEAESDSDMQEEDENGAEAGAEGGAGQRPYHFALTKKTVPLWLLPMIDYATRLLCKVDGSKLSSGGGKNLDTMQHLIVAVAELLVIAKLYPRNLALHKHCMRCSLRLLDSFTKSLVGLGKLMKDTRRPQQSREAVKQTLADIQKVTRSLVALGVHAKEQQTPSLLTLMPTAKMAYEKWLMAVKQFCSEHNINFTQGQLRNKDLKGVELLTQMSPRSQPQPQQQQWEEDGEEGGEEEEEVDERSKRLHAQRAAKRRRTTKSVAHSDDSSESSSSSSEEDNAMQSDGGSSD